MAPGLLEARKCRVGGRWRGLLVIVVVLELDGRDEGAQVLALFGEVTGAAAVMWGPSIVGYGELHYVYESGREGDMPRAAFSPRSASHTFYLALDAPGAPELLQRLGKHRTSVGCLYVTMLADIDLDVLRDLVVLAWEAQPQQGSGC